MSDKQKHGLFEAFKSGMITESTLREGLRKSMAYKRAETSMATIEERRRHIAEAYGMGRSTLEQYANNLQPKYTNEQARNKMKEYLNYVQQERMAMSSQSFHERWKQAFDEFGGSSTKVQPNEPDPVPMPEEPAAATPTSMWLEPEQNVPNDWVRFSEVFGFHPPSGNDRKGPVYTPETFTAELRSFIPSKQPGYFMPPEATEALWHAHIDKDVVWLYGKSGTGKSSLEEQFAAFIGQPFLRFNGREDIESSALFGQLTVEGGDNGGTVWKDGLLTEGVRHGARVLIDEATSIPAGIMLGIQWLLEREGKLMLTDKPASAGERLVTPDPRFRLTFADNTRGQGDDSGQFNGTGVMNTATLNRIGLTLEIEYLTPAQELLVLKTKFGKKVHETVLKDIVSLGSSLRRALAEDQLSLAFSLRNVESVIKKAYNYRTLPLGDALRRGFMEGYVNLLPNSDEQGAAIEFFNLTFSSY